MDNTITGLGQFVRGRSFNEEEMFPKGKIPVWKTFSVKLFFKTPEILYVKIRSCWQSLDPQLPGIASSNLSLRVGKKKVNTTSINGKGKMVSALLKILF